MNRNKIHKVKDIIKNEFELTACNRYYTDEGINRTNRDNLVTCLFCIAKIHAQNPPNPVEVAPRSHNVPLAKATKGA